MFFYLTGIYITGKYKNMHVRGKNFNIRYKKLCVSADLFEIKGRLFYFIKKDRPLTGSLLFLVASIISTSQKSGNGGFCAFIKR